MDPEKLSCWAFRPCCRGTPRNAVKKVSASCPGIRIALQGIRACPCLGGNLRGLGEVVMMEVVMLRGDRIIVTGHARGSSERKEAYANQHPADGGMTNCSFHLWPPKSPRTTSPKPENS